MGGYARRRIEAAEIRPPAIYLIMLYTKFFTKPPAIFQCTEPAKGEREQSSAKYLHMLVYKPILYHQYRGFELELE
jgi:hypothetical protein